MAEKLKQARAEIDKVFRGQKEAVDNTLITMIAGGNLLMVGVPGLGKTLFVSVIGKVMGLESSRVQFTPDMLPSDIIGSEVLEEDADGKKSFRFIKGPIFTQLLMADEINRAPPKTQSALLQAMQEHKVTVAGETHLLQKPFFVMATQNPVEQEGTYPLPEAQLDRFLMKIDIGYPDEEAERWLISNTTGPSGNLMEMFERAASGEDLTKPTIKDSELKVNSVLGKNDLILMRELAANMPLSDGVKDTILKLVRLSRPEDPNSPQFVKDSVEWGAGPRAAQALAKAARAKALIEGRTAPTVNDVLSLAQPILGHRIKFNYTAEAEGKPFEKAMNELKLKL
jgi:MoxR-like ATPase